MNNQFKKPYRFNDLCQFCEYGKNLKKKLSGIAIQKGFVLVGAKEDIISEFRQYLENSKNQKYYFMKATVKEFDRFFTRRHILAVRYAHAPKPKQFF